MNTNVLQFKCEHGWTGSPSRCKQCRQDAYRASKEGMPDLRKNVVLTENGRLCLSCNEGKPWDDFAKDIYGYNEKTADCKPCRNKYRKEKYPDKRILKDKVHTRYGVSWEYVVQTLANQFGRCANHGCSREISLEVKGAVANRAVIDHCHKTGKFRALLCGGCNKTLGVLESQDRRILGLMDYMNKHNHKLKE